VSHCSCISIEVKDHAQFQMQVKSAVAAAGSASNEGLAQSPLKERGWLFVLLVEYTYYRKWEGLKLFQVIFFLQALFPGAVARDCGVAVTHEPSNTLAN
jgi:hypothetical protein